MDVFNIPGIGMAIGIGIDDLSGGMEGVVDGLIKRHGFQICIDQSMKMMVQECRDLIALRKKIGSGEIEVGELYSLGALDRYFFRMTDAVWDLLDVLNIQEDDEEGQAALKRGHESIEKMRSDYQVAAASHAKES